VDSSTHSGDGLLPEAENTLLASEDAISADAGAINTNPGVALADVDTATISEAHEDLNARDTIAGLRAELATLKARLEVLETTDVAKAFARVDQLEDEREARLHELRLLVQDHREHIESAQKAIASVKQSSTWKVGNALISPISKITGRLPR
jgi:hypothetical protein